MYLALLPPSSTVALIALAAIAATLLVAALVRYLAPASTDFLPARDEDLNTWLVNFNFLVQASPGTYGLDAAAATALDPLVSAFSLALIAATNPVTRTTITVAQKDADKAAVKFFVRQLAKIVQATPSVLNASKLALGLPIHNDAPSPIPAPVTYPILGASPSGPRLVTLRFADSATPSSPRKPSGASQMLLMRKVSATPITDPEELTNADCVTRNPYVLDFATDDVGKKVYFCAKWVTRTGLEGPWSTMVNQTIA